jgi:hypothetical protein
LSFKGDVRLDDLSLSDIREGSTGFVQRPRRAYPAEPAVGFVGAYPQSPDDLVVMDCRTFSPDPLVAEDEMVVHPPGKSWRTDVSVPAQTVL